MTHHRTLPNSVLPFLWTFMRPKWPFLLVIICCPVVWAIVTTLSPFILKILIDSVIGFEGDLSQVWSIAWKPVTLFIGMYICLEMAMRLEEYLIIRTIPTIKAKIRGEMFNYAQKHSHRYFQDHLAGTLSNKVLDMVRAFETMFISIVKVFFPILINCFIAAGLLLTVHWWYSAFVLIWFTAYITITARYSQSCIKLSDTHSESNSALSGRIVDAFRNIITVRLFSRRSYENKDLDGYQREEVKGL